MSQSHQKKLKLLAVASAGGHWVQLRRISPAFEGANVRYLTTRMDLRDQVGSQHCYVVNDGNMSNGLKLIAMALRVFIVVAFYRPHVVISTGAAPGYMALVFGKLFGARTIWLDSIANAEEMSLAGRKVRRWADYWLTQWPDVAVKHGSEYKGSVI